MEGAEGEHKSPPPCCFVVGIIRHFFSETALAHIFIPQTYTPCGRVIGTRSYWLSWALPLWVAVPSPCAFIIAHLLENVKGFGKVFFKLWRFPSHDFLEQTFTASFPLDTLIVSQTFRLVNTLIHNFFKNRQNQTIDPQRSILHNNDEHKTENQKTNSKHLDYLSFTF